MRVAILGHGGQARLHARALKALPDVEFAGFGLRSALPHDIGVPARAAEDVIDDRSVDAVVIATPTSTHAALACAAFGRGKHVLCECPIAHTLDDADRMIEAARRAGRVFQVGLIHRFEAPYVRLIGEMRSGALGRIHAVETTRLSAHLSDGAQKAHHGDAIEELLTFDLHLLAWAFGRPASIAARAVDERGRARHVAALVSFPGLVASCTASSYLPAGFPFTERTRIFADVGHVEVVLELSREAVRWTYEVTRAGGAVERVPFAAEDPSIAQIRHFVELASGAAAENRADGFAARQMLELTLAAAAAARSGKAVDLA